MKKIWFWIRTSVGFALAWVLLCAGVGLVGVLVKIVWLCFRFGFDLI